MDVHTADSTARGHAHYTLSQPRHRRQPLMHTQEVQKPAGTCAARVSRGIPSVQAPITATTPTMRADTIIVGLGVPTRVPRFPRA